ncbi:MAG TPA: protocatechuate 3,4-dioxygenase subunit alpha [Hyphomicrobiaceae bacterium]|nr:protocatechuate 3,4-dioxygenase subunit alpha [Hyphomicrobiaceae bacterium]
MTDVSPSMTIGPFFHFAMTEGSRGDGDIATGNMLTPDAAGERIRIVGRVIDGKNLPLTGALIELWQADGQGRYAAPGDPRRASNSSFRGFGRCPTDDAGNFVFDTVRPGAVPGPGGKAQAPHIAVILHGRGLLRNAVTRIYFPDEAANATDHVLSLVPSEARSILIARREADQGGVKVYRFDIELQGPRAMQFFEV